MSRFHLGLRKSYIWKKLLKRKSNSYEVDVAELRFYLEFVRPGMLVLDVGANIGELTLLFSRLVGNTGRVHSFEPAQATFNALRNSIDYSYRTNIKLNNIALADSEGSKILNIYQNDLSGMNTFANRPLEQYGLDIEVIETQDVSTTTIDAYCTKNQIDVIDLLKIDVEGFELQVLLGAETMLSRNLIKCCVFEYGQTTLDMGNNPQMLVRFLREHGYKVKNIIRSDPSFPYDKKKQIALYSMHYAVPSKL